MSSNAAATDGRAGRAAEGARRAALRLAFGVTTCFAVVEALDWDATFLAPMLAANMLVKTPRPPSLAEGVVVVVLIAVSTAAVLLLSTLVISNPEVMILALMLVLYLSFYAHRRGAPELATLLPQISAVSLPIVAVLSPDGAGSFAATLVTAGFVALLTTWAAHAAFPAPALEPITAKRATAFPLDRPVAAARHALLDTMILMPLLTSYVLNATEAAVVVLIVVLTLLRLSDRQQGRGAVLGLILGNLIAGVAAGLTYNLILLGGTLPFFVVVCLAATLIFAGRIVTAGDRASVYVVALGTFVLLLGLGLSPLPGSSGEAFVSRLLNVILASGYAIGGLSLVEWWQPIMRIDPHGSEK
ncbi:DUF2955 domain-containing protein [Reyranella sp.]|uniref:DUF2955 domain-containing protein n=1 Tax=Reyranella sp. TaxID=1929291 RepID=UPI003D0A9624